MAPVSVRGEAGSAPQAGAPVVAPPAGTRTVPLSAPAAPPVAAPNQVRSNFESAAAVQAAQRITEAKAGAEAPAVAENVRPKTANTVTVKARRTVQGVPTSCLHTITMWDDYGDGWNGGFIDVYVDGELLLSGVTLAGGAGPETVTFAAATGQTVTTVWTGGDFPSEASYCITDVIGLQLGCDGLDGEVPTGLTVTADCTRTGACCNPFDATCSDNVDFDDCPAPMQFTRNVLCANLPVPCGDPGVCCVDAEAACSNGLRANCTGRFLSASACEDFSPACGEYHACQHKVVLDNDSPLGWNNGAAVLNVYVNGTLVLEGLTVFQEDALPITHTFTAGDLDHIVTEFLVPPGWIPPASASYCIYDGAGRQLVCDGGNGQAPVGTAVLGLCSGSGACCDPSTGVCTDGVDVWNCQPPLGFTLDTQCADLPVPCGNPGACCDQATGACTQEFEVNCTGRFAAGQQCEDGPFTPPCGANETCRVLIVPAHSEHEYTTDNDFMARLSSRTFSTTDFMPGVSTTPTLEQLQNYDMVITYADAVYHNRKAMGNVLADYVESGGKVILGNYAQYTQGNIDWLDGRLMKEYSPAEVTSTDWGANYAEDGTDCMFDGVGTWRALPWDIITGVRGSAAVDGTYFNDDSFSGPPSAPVAAYRLDRTVTYVAGYMAGWLASSGEEEALAELTANICFCEPDGSLTGACCDPFTGTCTDNVPVTSCMPPLRWTEGTLCADLPVPCGNPGACCRDDLGGCTIELERNCSGRFVAGATCETAGFDPACGVSGQYDVLYAPTHPDNPQFRAELAFELNSQVDYLDARVSLPTLAQLLQYEAVITWTDYPYAGAEGEFGDLLADYVEAGGKVILGLWSIPGAGQFNWLGGRLQDEYAPAIIEDTLRGGGDYQNDGVDCVHNGIDFYGTLLLDVVTGVTPKAWYDGTLANVYGDTSLAVSFLLDRSVYHISGFAGNDGPGQWAQLIANILRCPESEVRGACCSFENGACLDDVLKQDCLPPRQWTHATTCADLDPQCGWPGACCDDAAGTCTETVFAQCTGRHIIGETCATASFNPPCGEYEPCTHTLTAWSDYDFGWVEASLDVYVGGLIRIANFTIPSGTGPVVVPFAAAEGEEITVVWHPGKFNGGYDFVASYCIKAADQTTLGCDGLDGWAPTGITVYGSCAELVCGNGICQAEGGENCALCPEDCGSCRCVDQPMTSLNAYMSDLDCQYCSGLPLQLLAENFAVYQPNFLASVTFWGTYAPGENVPATDAFTVRILENSGGAPSAELFRVGPVAGTRTSIGNGMFEYTVDLNVTLPHGIYYIEIYGDTKDSDESWAWATGASDLPFGQTGLAFSIDYPEQWSYTPGLELAFRLNCGAAPAAGDMDGDGDVDLADYAAFADCLFGPGAAYPFGCFPADLDGDDDVDLEDFATLSRLLTSPD